MAKNREATDIFGGVGDLIATAKENINARNTQHTHDTQRKQKYPRINMAFYGDNLDYVREAAYKERVSVTEYINQLIVDDKNRRLIKKSEPEQIALFEGE